MRHLLRSEILSKVFFCVRVHVFLCICKYFYVLVELYTFMYIDVFLGVRYCLCGDDVCVYTNLITRHTCVVVFEEISVSCVLEAL